MPSEPPGSSKTPSSVTNCDTTILLTATETASVAETHRPGCGTTLMYGLGESHSPKISLASSSETEPAMITSSPCCQFTGVATLCCAVSCSEYSLQLTAQHRVATPVNWQQGEDVIIAGSVSDDEAKEIFGEWDSPKPYIRVVPQPEERSEVGATS